MEGTIRHAGISEGRYLHGQLGDECDDSLSVTMSLRVHSIWSQYSMGTFLWACWTEGMVGLVLMVLVQGMLPMVLKEQGIVHSSAAMSWATAVGGLVVSAWVGLGLLGVGISGWL